MNELGKNILLSVSGESHSPSIVLRIKNIEKGHKISIDKINFELKRRNPKFFFNTERAEDDEFKILSGIKDYITTGEDIVVEFINKNIDKSAYIKNEGFLRPGHSDYTRYIKNGFFDTGGGMSSGRVTLPFSFASSIFKQILEEKGVIIVSRIKQIYNIKDKEIKNIKELLEIKDDLFPCITKEFYDKAQALLKDVKAKNDSCGGIIETYILNLKAGIGEPLFNSLESTISSALFSIPAVKGVEFGDGFDFAHKLGSEVLDSFILDKNAIKTKENHNGGINGGISNSMPVIIRTVVKPTPTIGIEVESLNIKTLKEERVVFGGRHDSFIANRAIPAIEGMIAHSLLDLDYEKR